MNTMKNTDCGFKIYSFMQNELKLSGNELIIFAIIHSFTMGTNRIYFGSQERLSELANTSYSSTRRIIKILLKKGYIEKCEDLGRKGYRSRIDEAVLKTSRLKAEKSEKSIKMAANEEKETQKSADKLTKEVIEATKPEDKKERNKVLLSPDLPVYIYEGDDEEEPDEELDDEFEDEPKPKYTFEFFGSPGGGNIFMTRQQYAELQKLVDPVSLTGYISKLDRMMIRDGYRTFSPYQTIKRWIEADAKL